MTICSNWWNDHSNHAIPIKTTQLNNWQWSWQHFGDIVVSSVATHCCTKVFSQGDVLPESCSLKPASGCHWWKGWWEKQQRWGIVWNSFNWLCDVLLLDGVVGGRNRDEVLCGVFYLIVLNLFSLQVLEYDGSTWSEKEAMQTARYNHAIIEANLPSLCPAMGNLNHI